MAERAAVREFHIQAYRASGRSRAAYCREAGIPVQRLYRWLRAHAGVVADAGSAGNGNASVGFVEVRRSLPEAGSLVVEVCAGGAWGAALRFPLSADPSWVVQVLRGVGAAC